MRIDPRWVIARRRVRDLCYLAGFALIVLVSAVIAVAALFLALGLRISALVVPVAGVLTALAVGAVMIGPYRRLPWSHRLGVLVLTLAMVAGSLGLAGSMHDTSWDGQDYHQTAVLELSRGWNPYYRDLGAPPTYDPDVYETFTHLWVNHYPKASWYFAASVLAVTGNIEHGKCINTLMIAASFFLCLSALLSAGRIAWLPAVLLSLLAAANPVTMYQYLSFYVDGLLSSVFVCLFAACFIIIRRRGSAHRYALLALLLALAVNLKFTGVVFAAIVAAGGVVGVAATRRSPIEALRMALVCALSVAVGLVGLGFSPYVTNTRNEGHPLYPVYGDGAIDIMTLQYPHNFRSIGGAQRFFLSLFSRSGGYYRNGFVGTDLKIPFTVAPDELPILNVDPRVGGFGPLMSGAVIVAAMALSLGVAHAIRSGRKREHGAFLLTLAGLCASVIVMPESWWARYVPQLWLVPVLVTTYSLRQAPRRQRSVPLVAACYAAVLVMALNVALVTVSYATYNTSVNVGLRYQLGLLRDASTPPDVDIDYFAEAYRNKLETAGIAYREVPALAASGYRKVDALYPSFGRVRFGIR